MTMTPTHTGELDPAESARLVRLERTVDRAVEVAGKIAGEALATIRDERLYRITHSTFEAYVNDRWGFSKTTAYRMIEASSPPPPPKEVEGSSQRGTNPQPTPEALGALGGGNGAGPDEPPTEPLPTVDACRIWARVIDTGGGTVGVRVDDGAREYPEVGQRVLLMWER